MIYKNSISVITTILLTNSIFELKLFVMHYSDCKIYLGMAVAYVQF